MYVKQMTKFWAQKMSITKIKATYGSTVIWMILVHMYTALYRIVQYSYSTVTY
jgi:hypothetical protein